MTWESNWVYGVAVLATVVCSRASERYHIYTYIYIYTGPLFSVVLAVAGLILINAGQVHYLMPEPHISASTEGRRTGPGEEKGAAGLSEKDDRLVACRDSQIVVWSAV